MKEAIKIVKLSEDSELMNQALKLFVDVFETEAITSSQFDLSQPAVKEKFFRVLHKNLQFFLDNGYEIYVAIEDQEILGLTIVAGENKLAWHQKAQLTLKHLPNFFPLLTSLNYKNFFALAKGINLKETLPEPYLSLVVIAVSQNHQGKGIGKLLLNFLEENFQDKYTGIYLYTGAEKNYQFYNHLGYDLIEKKQTSLMTIYHMFLPFK